MIDKETITTLADDACQLYRTASILAYHIVSKRVTHTSRTLSRLLMPLARMIYSVQTRKSFGGLLKQTFEQAVDRRGGSWEIQLADDGTIWIHGSFTLDELRKYLLTVPQHPEIKTERTDG